MGMRNSLVSALWALVDMVSELLLLLLLCVLWLWLLPPWLLQSPWLRPQSVRPSPRKCAAVFPSIFPEMWRPQSVSLFPDVAACLAVLLFPNVPLFLSVSPLPSQSVPLSPGMFQELSATLCLKLLVKQSQI